MTSFSAVFLDRDGTIVRDRSYLRDPGGVELLPGAAEAIARLNAHSVPVVVVTNQSGIGRGLCSVEEFEAVQREVERQLEAEGATVDGVYYCPHDPGGGSCSCRKPGLALYERASAELGGIQLSEAVFVGDRLEDVLPAVALGARGFLVSGGLPERSPLPPGCERVAGVVEAVTRVLGGRRPHG
ncbi:MAG: D-glycero-alpha-D-manno-heptose-1,7-bisphosphate 7-phosphatase [Gemmatimonadota bacterium]